MSNTKSLEKVQEKKNVDVTSGNVIFKTIICVKKNTFSFQKKEKRKEKGRTYLFLVVFCIIRDLLDVWPFYVREKIVKF